MLTARPVIVQIIAADTPLAMLRASALPRSAIESNTSSMPLTVPIRPSSGAIGTSTCITGNPAVMAPFKREIIVWRIWRAHHEEWSVRARHSASIFAACPGRIILKYQSRSMINAHISTPDMKMKKTNIPPSDIRSAMSRTTGSCSSTALLLQVLRQDAGALLVQDLHHRLRQRSQQRAREQQRDRDAEAEHRGDHRLADAVGHELRIARAGLGDALEGEDHADYRADQAEQRAGRDAQPQERLEALESRHLAEHRLGDPELGHVGILLDGALVALEREQHAA